LRYALEIHSTAIGVAEHFLRQKTTF